MGTPDGTSDKTGAEELSVPCFIVCNQLHGRGNDEARCVPMSIRRNWPP